MQIADSLAAVTVIDGFVFVCAHVVIVIHIDCHFFFFFVVAFTYFGHINRLKCPVSHMNYAITWLTV